MLNNFMYNQEMEKIYKLCYQSIKPGGTLTVLIKDVVEKGKRVSISDWVLKCCIRSGFELSNWFKWYAKGGFFVSLHESKGMYVIKNEEIIIVRRP